MKKIKAYEEGLRVPTSQRIKGLHYYDLTSEGFQCVEIKKFGVVNHIGTLITNEPIKEVERGEYCNTRDFENNYEVKYCATMEELTK